MFEAKSTERRHSFFKHHKQLIWHWTLTHTAISKYQYTTMTWCIVKRIIHVLNKKYEHSNLFFVKFTTVRFPSKWFGVNVKKSDINYF